MIESDYRVAEKAGLALWCQDEAGPYQTKPHPGTDWRVIGKLTLLPHEYIREGTAKQLTMLRPATGQV